MGVLSGPGYCQKHSKQQQPLNSLFNWIQHSDVINSDKTSAKNVSFFKLTQTLACDHDQCNMLRVVLNYLHNFSICQTTKWGGGRISLLSLPNLMLVFVKL